MGIDVEIYDDANGLLGRFVPHLKDFFGAELRDPIVTRAQFLRLADSPVEKEGMSVRVIVIQECEEARFDLEDASEMGGKRVGGTYFVTSPEERECDSRLRRCFIFPETEDLYHVLGFFEDAILWPCLVTFHLEQLSSFLTSRWVDVASRLQKLRHSEWGPPPGELSNPGCLKALALRFQSIQSGIKGMANAISCDSNVRFPIDYVELSLAGLFRSLCWELIWKRGIVSEVDSEQKVNHPNDFRVPLPEESLRICGSSALMDFALLRVLDLIHDCHEDGGFDSDVGNWKGSQYLVNPDCGALREMSFQADDRWEHLRVNRPNVDASLRFLLNNFQLGFTFITRPEADIKVIGGMSFQSPS